MLKRFEMFTSVRLCEICNKDKADVFRAIPILEKKGLVMRENVTVNGYRAKIKFDRARDKY